jgi:hypothetical protein
MDFFTGALGISVSLCARPSLLSAESKSTNSSIGVSDAQHKIGICIYLAMLNIDFICRRYRLSTEQAYTGA